MTVQSEVPFKQITADGGTASFSGNFTILDEDDLVVYEDGVLSTSGFTVSGVGVSKGATITYGSNPKSGTVITILRKMEAKRETNYANSGDFVASTVNADFDRAILVLQEIFEKSKLRMLSFSEFEEGRTEALNQLPSPAANELVYWDSSKQLKNTGITKSTLQSLINTFTSGLNPVDAYETFSGTPTYVNAYTFTLTGDQTSSFPVGRKLRLSDSSTVYGVVTSSTYSSLTTIEVLATDDLSGALSSVAWPVESDGDQAGAITLEKRTYVVKTSRTISEDFEIPKGALISVSSSQTLTIQGHIRTGIYQIFTGSGAVAGFTNFTVYPEWWGVVTGSDNYAALQAAFNIINGRGNLAVPLETTVSAGIVDLGPRTYRTDTELLIYDRTTLSGCGDRLTYIDGMLISSGAVLKTNRFGSGTVNQFIDIKDLTVYGDASGGSINGIEYACFGGHVDKVQIKNCADGLVIGDSGNSNTLVEIDITGIKIHECINGIHGAAGGKATDVKIKGGVINACSNACILSEGSGGWQVEGINLYNADYLIRFVNTVASNTITGCYLGESEKTAIYLNFGNGSSSGTISITGNIFKTANNSGAATVDADKANIALVNNGAATDAEGISISGNTFRDTTGNATSAVYMSGLFSKTCIGPNTYELANASATPIKFPTNMAGISVCEPQIDLYASEALAVTVTISSGDAEINNVTNIIESETGTSDDLFTLSGICGSTGLKKMDIFLSPASGHTITVKDSTFKLAGGDFVMDSTEDWIHLRKEGTVIYEISRSDNA